MEYGKIVNKSFNVAWNYKSLWIFGLFAGGGASGFNWNTGEREQLDVSSFGFDTSAFTDIYHILASLLIWFGLLVLALICLYFIATPALIDAVNRITRGGTYRFSDSFSVGLDNFFKFVGLGIVFFFVIVVGSLLTIGVGALCFVLHWVIGVLSLLVLIPFGICAVVTGSSIYCLAQRAIVVRKVSIGDGLAEGVTLFKNNIGHNVVMFLIDLGLSFCMAIIVAIIWAIFGIPIAAISLAAGFGMAAAFVAAFVMGLPISLIIGGFAGTVLTNLYTIFYFELLEPSQPTTPDAPPAPDLAGA